MKKGRKNKKLFIIIAAFNESPAIQKVIREVKRAGYKKIIVVDDGSEDATFQKAKRAKVITLRHMINRGKGAAIKTGMEAAKLLNAGRVVTMDADGQHDPRDIQKMLRALDKNYDIVLGSRLLNSKGMPYVKIIANQIGNLLTWIIYGMWVSDSQCGFRAFSRKALNEIDTRHDQYEYDSEVIREINKNELRYIELPIKVRYTEYSMNKEQKQSLSNGIKTMFRLAFSE